MAPPYLQVRDRLEASSAEMAGILASLGSTSDSVRLDVESTLDTVQSFLRRRRLGW